MFSPKYSLSWLVAVMFCLAATLPALADSHVRIVRLSYIEGGVQVSRAGAQSAEKAMTNMPIAEGMELKTADDGKAEVEFEDGSTLRIVPGSAVQFQKLSLSDSGQKVSEVQVQSGTAYVNFLGTKDADLSIQFATEKLALTHTAHLRLDLKDQNSSIAVFKGIVQVESPAGTVEIKKNQSANFGAASEYKLAKNIEREPWDSWDDQQNEYHERYALKSNNNYSPYAYGTTDLAYYGNFVNYPGYGMLWQPYFAGMGWDPFMDGAWMFYPGWGFGWVSAYPWGWTPYHYGTWVFVPGFGWGWQPGGVWSTWYAQPRVMNPPKGYVVPQAPANGTRTVMVSRGSASTMSNNKMVLRGNSAGLGIPRGQVRNMSKLSQQTQEHGTMTQRVAMAPPPRPAESSPRGNSRMSEPLSRPSASMPAPSPHSSGGTSPHR